VEQSVRETEDAAASAEGSTPIAAAPPTGWSAPGGGRELIRLALPLILSNSIWTLEITTDRIFLSWLGEDHVGAAMAAAMLFWTPLCLLQATAAYATTFVAQYVGAGRPERVGPVVWQALYFSVLAGLAFLGLLPLVESIVALGGHSAHLQELEATYLRCLCFSALPTLITAATTSFFAGRGASWTVLAINASGLLVNGVLVYAWIFGRLGFPAWGIAGAGWATVCGTSASASVSLILLLRPAYRAQFRILSGWRPDPALLRRLLHFGLPSGLHIGLDVLAWTVFLFIVGRLGDAELSASSIAFTLNMVGFLPAMGISQGIGILVGQRLGQDRADLAERTTWIGFKMSSAYMAAVVLAYVLAPSLLLLPFQLGDDGDLHRQVAALAPVLLWFVAVYSLFDNMNLVFAFALKGAGDTRFVTVMAVLLAWPIMVLPTWAVWQRGGGLYWAWTFASLYIVALALVFLWRFYQGRWKTMRVIETKPAVEAS
jgi:MATE family multidrug resistance protein